MPFHFGQGAEAANQHTWYARDPVSNQPQLKSSPVQPAAPQLWRARRRGCSSGNRFVRFRRASLRFAGDPLTAPCG